MNPHHFSWLQVRGTTRVAFVVLACAAWLVGCGGGATNDTQVDTDDHSRFVSAEECGRCHSRQYGEWRQSMHAYSAISPVFQALEVHMLESGTLEDDPDLCRSCHAPLEGLEGGDIFSETTQRTIAEEGVTCEVCHRAQPGEDPRLGNVSLDLRPGPDKYGPFVSDIFDSHGNVQSDFSTSSELCASCHEVFVGDVQIHSPYTEYVGSPSDLAGERCEDCHMSHTQGVLSSRPEGWAVWPPREGASPERSLSSHRFIGPDYSLIDAFPYPENPESNPLAQEEHFEEVVAFLKRSIAIKAASVNQENGAWTIDVTLENLIAAHNVPTGLAAERQLWLHVWLEDAAGEVLAASGDLDANGDLRDHFSADVQAGSVLADDQLVNLQSVSWKDTENGAEEVLVGFQADRIESRGLKPLEERTVRYRFEDVPGAVKAHVRLRYRNLSPALFRLIGLEDLVDRIRIVDLDEKLGLAQ